MSPLGFLAILCAILSMLAYSRRPTKSFRVDAQFAISLLTWGVLWFATGSTFAREGMMSLPIHMICHILVMFIVPIGIVGSSFIRSLWWILDASSRRRLLRWWYLDRRWRAPKWLFHPLTAALVLNVVMVSAHVPVVFDFVMGRTWAMDWLMEPAFLFSGLFFFHFLIPSPPRVNHVKIRYQLTMVTLTFLEMLFLAMAMSIFTKTSWYSVMVPGHGMAAMPGMVDVPGMAKTAAAAFSQQRLAAGILWICGDFWALPVTILIVQRTIKREGSLFAALDRQSSRLSGVVG
ncbi:MAG: cytochrome c oxidase assembly protein [Acidimicrobiales bacterium]